MPAVFPITRVPATHRGHYPHMSKRDVEVWARFLERRAQDFAAFAYDVAIGGITLDTPLIDQAGRDGWRYNTALKIDACGFQPGRVWIIEVKPEATVSALGAAIAYTLVAKRDRVFDDPLQPTIVCAYCQVDVRWCAAQLGVSVLEFPP